MRLLPVLFLTVLVVAEVSTEAFFWRTSRKPSSRPKYARPGRTVKSYGGGGQRKPSYPVKSHQNKIPTTPVKPHFSKKPRTKPTKSYPKRPYQTKLQYPQRPIQKQRYPSARPQKLDFSGWKPIGFEDDRKKAVKPYNVPQTTYSGPQDSHSAPQDFYSAPQPSYNAPQNSYSAPQVSDVVTVDVAIANAPPAETDDGLNLVGVYSEPPPEPIVKEEYIRHSTPAKNSYNAVPTVVKPVSVPSSYGSPVPAVPYKAPAQYTAQAAVPQYKAQKYNSPAPKYKSQAPKYNAPAPAPKYKATSSSAPQYRAPSPKYNSPAPAPKYKAPAPAPKYNAPAPAPQYSAPAPAPQYSAPAPAPQYSAPAPAPQYNAPAPAPQYNSPAPAKAPQYSSPAPVSQYNAPAPAYAEPAPAPAYEAPAQEPLKAYGGHDASPPSYNSFVDQEFPIISLITADSDVPEEEKYVSFTINKDSGYNLPQEQPPQQYQQPQQPAQQYQQPQQPAQQYQQPQQPAKQYQQPQQPAQQYQQPQQPAQQYQQPQQPVQQYHQPQQPAQQYQQQQQPQYQSPQDEYPSPVQYQNTGDPTSLAEEVSSGSVYVQQDQGLNDELYYIYYQDPDQDPNYGSKVKKSASSEGLVLSTLQSSHLNAGAPASDIPLYDYDDLDLEYLRDARDQDQTQYSNYHNIGGQSSVSVNFSHSGKNSGFSYQLN